MQSLLLSLSMMVCCSYVNPCLVKALARQVCRQSPSPLATRTTFSKGAETTSWAEFRQENFPSKILVVGDGDLSYSARLAQAINSSSSGNPRPKLTATVLEDKATHQSVYRSSEENSESIERLQQQVLFGIDATNLLEHFAEERFDRVTFNFPHWRGKSNNRYNRRLLEQFLQSASQVVTDPDGEIHVALCPGQGGSESKSMIEWRQSWMAAVFAAEHFLLLKRIEYFHVDYTLSSHRGVDRAFAVGDQPLLYAFGRPDGKKIDQSLQVSCRHELRLEIPELGTEEYRRFPFDMDKLISGEVARMMVADVLCEFPGIRAEIPFVDVIEIGSSRRLLVHLIVYAGEESPLTRKKADEIRAQLEDSVAGRLGLRIAKKGRTVSKAFPYSLFKFLVDDYLEEQQKQ